MRVLLDTNVVLDAILIREPNIESVKIIFKSIYSEQISGEITANSITDIYYISQKRLGSEETRRLIYELLMAFYIVSVGEEECLTAIKSEMPDFEDAIVVACAVKDDVDYIITNDIEFQATKFSNIPILSSNAFVKEFL
jgi:Predicted nucleic acid-binding protein, contains PIN domain